MGLLDRRVRAALEGNPETADPVADAVPIDACRRVRSGFGEGWACRTHGRSWPCSLHDQAYEQITLLRGAIPPAPGIVLEVVEELLHTVDVIPPSADEGRQAPDWVELIVEYLNRANVEGGLLSEREAVGAPLDTREWRRRLIQVAAIAVSGVAWCDRTAGRVLDA